MSTILKALKRLDEQRRADASPRTLEEQVLAGFVAREQSGSRPNKWLLASAGAGALLVVSGVAWFAATRTPEPPPVAAAAPESQAAEDPRWSRAIERAPSAALPAEGAPIAGTQFDPAVRERLRAQASRGEFALPERAAGLRPTRSTQPEPEPFAEVKPASSEAAPPRLAASSPIGAELPAPAPEAITRTPTPEPAPKPALPARAEPSPEPEVAVVAHRPDVWVERTQWHPSPDKRSAIVRIGEGFEARELREGDAVDGVVVKEIRPSGVLFLHEGAEFKRGVGAS